MSKRLAVIATAATVYLLLFLQTDHVGSKGDPNIMSPTMPVKMHKAVMGFLYQIEAERLYIKTMTFLGGTNNKDVPPPFADTLYEHFNTMHQLHPYLFDIYWTSEAFLSWYGDEYVKHANAILESGIHYLPERWQIPFLLGFNYFYFLGDTASAYRPLLIASEVSGNNFMRHLASVLAAKEGNLKAGLTWLKAMRDKESNKEKKATMSRDVDAFEKAIMVQEKVNDFRKEKGDYPKALEDLVPEYLAKLPEIQSKFEIKYQDGIVKLERPGYKDRRPSSRRGETSHPE